MSEPVVFDGFTGSFQAASGAGSHPVLMLSPFGYEELCGCGFWTALADGLAAAGMASLRFDYPGTANALDATGDGIEDWRQAATVAADALRQRTGRSRIVLLGQGLGATLAMHWASGLGPLAGAVLLEPTMSGRAYLRGLKAWGASIAAASGLTVDPKVTGDHAVAGFPLSDARAAAIRALDGSKIGALPVPALLCMEQPGGMTGKTIMQKFGASGIDIARSEFKGYADLLTDPTSARVPAETIASIVAWLAARPPEPNRDQAYIICAASQACGEALLRGEGFAERPIRFGPGRGLAGVLCLPGDPGARHSAVVIVNAGRDHSIGWARSAVEQARALAREGVASLRFDFGGIGDSRARAGAPDELLYSKRMCEDLRAAVDHMHGLGYPSLGLAGRCSGAWAAFTVAVADARISRVALVNTGYFLWDDTKSLAEVIRFAQRNVGDLGTTFLRRNGLRRLLKGQLDVRGAGRFVLRQLSRRVLRRCAPMLGRLTAESRRYHDLHALFAVLRARDVRMLLAYAEGDTSMDELRSFMGKGFGKLDRYPGVSVCSVPGADHNFTPQAAKAELAARLLTLFRTGNAAPQPLCNVDLRSATPSRQVGSHTLIARQL